MQGPAGNPASAGSVSDGRPSAKSHVYDTIASSVLVASHLLSTEANVHFSAVPFVERLTSS